jgi:hypothetical protein
VSSEGYTNHQATDLPIGGLDAKGLSMKLRITITVQTPNVPETPVFETDIVAPEMVYSTLEVAEQTACATAAAIYGGQACIKEYLGPTLIAVLHSGEGDFNRKIAPLQFVLIRNKLSGKVLDVSALSEANGAVIQQWEHLSGANQQWQLALTENHYCKIMNRLSRKVIDVPSGSRDDATAVQQWDDHDGDNQKWQLAPIDTGHYTLVNKLSGKVLEVADSSQADGAPIQQRDYLGRDNQKWQITRVFQTNERLNFTNNIASSHLFRNEAILS